MYKQVDSGSPLICNDKIEGVLAMAKNKCGNSPINIYMRVAPARQWIEKKLKDRTCSKANNIILKNYSKIILFTILISVYVQNFLFQNLIKAQI